MQLARDRQGKRVPRAIQALLLLSTSSLAVMVTAVLGPSVPKMQAHFASVPGAEYLVPLAVTIPLAMMALLSVLAGVLADRFGRKRMLVGALLFYGIIGSAPMWLDSLNAILAVRLALGVFDAAIMTASTVMIGDYYHGAKRQRMLALGTTVSSLSAVVLTVLGGALGAQSWRTPYAVYGIALLLAPLMQVYLWESRPTGQRRVDVESVAEEGVIFRPRLLAGICVVGLFAGIAFIFVPIHLGFLMESIGIRSTQSIGVSISLHSLGVVGGTLLFGWVLAQRLSVPYQLATSVVLAGLGCLGMAMATTYAGMTAAAVLNGIGAGVLLPTLSTWNMRELPFAQRGLGTGAFMSSTFLGMALNPLVIVYFAQTLGGHAAAVAALGVLLLTAAVIAGVQPVLRRRFGWNSDLAS